MPILFRPFFVEKYNPAPSATAPPTAPRSTTISGKRNGKPNANNPSRTGDATTTNAAMGIAGTSKYFAEGNLAGKDAMLWTMCCEEPESLSILEK
mmetsp:Transcript_50692/g.59199  ORF Transcript_50692/g.59199 Transcript_50692/m.59199 type:complete len:95 (+) Transcript_50692:685-969(+)